MNLAKRRAGWLLVGMVLACAAIAPAARGGAADTAFTYQGQLKENGAPADGLHDFRFRLFDAASGGAQVGQSLCVDNVDVVNGLFTLPLDFGQQYATTAPRHLEIQVRRDIGQPCTDDFGYVLLSPRQQLTATPLAGHAKSAFSLAAADGSPANVVIVDNTGRVGIGTPSPTKLLHVGDSNVANSEGMIRLASRTGTGGPALRIWDVGVPETEDIVTGIGYSFVIDDFFLGTTPEMLVQWGTGNVGIGTIAPLSKLDVRGDIRLGPSGQLRAASGEENLRLIRGVVAADGAILRGTGFTVAHPSVGNYVITFNTPFTGPPSITATGERFDVNPVGVDHTIMTDVATSGNATLVSTGNGDWRDGGFHFIAVGPR